MKLDLNPQSLHHAYFIEGNSELVLPKLFSFLKDEMSVVFEGNPDAHISTHDTFGIDEGRLLKEQQANRAFDGGKKIFIISFNSITTEAQNSLLKVFEEPTEHTHFFLVSNTSNRILPTLKSRLIVIKHEHEERVSSVAGAEFLAMNLKDRLALITKISEDKDKKKALLLVQNIIGIYKNKKPLIQLSKEERNTLNQLLTLEGYIEDRSSSIKMLLEHVAHIFPVGKM